MIIDPECLMAKKIGDIWFCSLGCYGDILCRIQSDKTTIPNCQWKIETNDMVREIWE